jgi:hypothetical protein
MGLFSSIGKFVFGDTGAMVGGFIDSAVGLGSDVAGYEQDRKAQSRALDATQSNIQFQKEFAQHGISWKVADAKEAGVHPLVALGANITPFSPVPVFTGSTGNAMRRIGQNVIQIDNYERLLKRKADELSLSLGEEQLTQARLETFRKMNEVNNAIPGQTDSRISNIPGPTPDMSLYTWSTRPNMDLGNGIETYIIHLTPGKEELAESSFPFWLSDNLYQLKNGIATEFSKKRQEYILKLLPAPPPGFKNIYYKRRFLRVPVKWYPPKPNKYKLSTKPRPYIGEIPISP